MTVYDLYLESGPRHRRTMIHVLDLLGCVAVGATTEAALAATPDAIRAYRYFLQQRGEVLDADDSSETQVVEHVSEGQWLGQGSPYISFDPDLAPLDDEDVGRFLLRLEWINEALAAWVEGHDDAALDVAPAGGGRPARAVLLHVIGAGGAYLTFALGSAPGFSRLRTRAERGEVDPPTALRRYQLLVEERVAATSAEQRDAVRRLASGDYTLRKAFRRLLEHGWEHLGELERRSRGSRA